MYKYTHMLQVLQECNLYYGPLDGNTLLVTLDVVGLPPSVGDFIHIMDHILKNNVFEFDWELFQQVFGTALGTPMARSLAKLFMAWLEEPMVAVSTILIPREAVPG